MKQLACALALLAAPLFANDSPAKSKSRSLPEMISLAVDSGKDTIIADELSGKIGLPKVDQTARKIRYKAGATPDKLDHAFDVIVNKDQSGKLVPVGILLISAAMTKADGAYYIEGNSYYASLSGKFQK